MIKKIFFAVACFQVTASLFAQTEVQKQVIYEQINRNSKGKGIIQKIDHIENKEVLFNNAQVLPVYKVAIKPNENPKIIQNKNYYLIFYVGRLYIFMNNKISRVIENNPIIQSILNFNKEKKDYSIIYFTDTFSFDQQYLMPLLTNKELSLIIDKGISYNFQNYIDTKYGYMEKYAENYILDEKREKLTVSDFNDMIVYNYKAFEANCPIDTVFVLKRMINQIMFATKSLTKAQEVKLFERIMYKINPNHGNKAMLRRILTAAKVKELDIQAVISQSKIENKKAPQEITKPQGLYVFDIYNVSVTDELFSILSNQQFIDYKSYIDLWYPIIETQNSYNNNKYRYNYGMDILEKDNIIKKRDYQAFNEYVRKKLET